MQSQREGATARSEEATAPATRPLFGAWRVEHALARSARTSVYAVVHPNGRHAVIKALDAVGHEASFEREIALTRIAVGAGAPAVLEQGRREGGAPYVVLERLHGWTLERHADARQRFDAVTTVTVGRLLIELVERLHESGVVHRDVAPANVFVTIHGALRLLDFGLALRRSELRLRGAPPPPSLYRAPEQTSVRSDPADPRADVFSLGAVLRRLLTGAPDGDLDDAPFGVRRFLLCATHRDPRQRFPSAGAMRRVLELLSADVGSLGSASQPPPPPDDEGPSRPRRRTC